MCPLTRQLTGTQFSRAGADEKAAYAGRVLTDLLPWNWKLLQQQPQRAAA
jgi:hypothetical protein